MPCFIYNDSVSGPLIYQNLFNRKKTINTLKTGVLECHKGKKKRKRQQLIFATIRMNFKDLSKATEARQDNTYSLIPFTQIKNWQNKSQVIQ